MIREEIPFLGGVSMNRFQQQSQWENDFQQNITIEDQSGLKSRKEITVSKQGLIFVGVMVVLVSLCLIALYVLGRPIEGTWTRQADDNSTLAGMKVQVRRDGALLEGEIVEMPANAYAFEVGQIKWHMIKKVGFGKYEYYDLTHADGTDQYYYGTSSLLTVLPGGKQLTVTTDGSSARGNYQIWVKQK